METSFSASLNYTVEQTVNFPVVCNAIMLMWPGILKFLHHIPIKTQKGLISY